MTTRIKIILKRIGMQVIKRSGKREPLDTKQIRKQTIPACSGLDGVSYEELELSMDIFFQDGIETKDIQKLLIKTAVTKIDVDKPNWTYVAARLSLYDLYHNIKRLYHVTGSGDVYEKVTLEDYLNYNSDRFDSFKNKYTREEIKELNDYIVGDRDLLFDYLGADTCIKRYLTKDSDGNPVELPQHMHMGIAMFLAQNEKDKLYWAKRFYTKTSLLEVINSTPINSYARLKDGSMISCLIASFPDNLVGILDKFKEVGIGSQLGSGWGFDLSRVRSIGSTINNKKDKAGGKIPFLKLLNDLSIAVDQRGERPGAFAATIESWDIDIFDFIDLKKKNGEERRRAQDLFLAIAHNKVFIERCENESEWTLFDPYDAPELTEIYGEEFKIKYEEYEQDFKLHPENYNKNTKTIEAMTLMRKIIVSYFEEGGPFIYNKDAANEKHHRKELGIIRSLNLCTEIAQATNENETAVCNLGSLNLARLKTPEKLKEATITLHRALDNIIDLTKYPSEESKRTQLFRRSIGIGMLGEAEAIANLQIHYGSDEHIEWIDETYGLIKSTIDNYNKELGLERGTQEGYVDRNLYTTAIAPNSTSGVFAGTTNSHEPVYDTVWMEENMLGTFKLTAPNININNIEYYKNPYEIDIYKYLDTVATRQKHIDMTISTNLYFDPENTTARTIYDVIVYMFKKDILSGYYLRSKPPKNKEVKENVIKCVGCEN